MTEEPTEELIADEIRVGNCEPDCPCQRVHIRLSDSNDLWSMEISLAPDDARKVSRALLRRADLADAAAARIAGRLA